MAVPFSGVIERFQWAARTSSSRNMEERSHSRPELTTWRAAVALGARHIAIVHGEGCERMGLQPSVVRASAGTACWHRLLAPVVLRPQLRQQLRQWCDWKGLRCV